MSTPFDGDQQPDPSIADAGHGPADPPVEPTIADRLEGLPFAGSDGGDDPGSWRPAQWPAAQELIDPDLIMPPARPAEPTAPGGEHFPQLTQLGEQLPAAQIPAQPGHQPGVHLDPARHIPHQGTGPIPVIPPITTIPQISQIPQRTGYDGGFSPPYFPNDYPSDDFGDEASRVRPYAWTRGRTRSSVDLQLETLVSTSELGQDEATLTLVEYRTVGSLCRHPHSVAEVAAKLSVPLGVAKVILSDMAELGLISIHRTFADDDIAAHLVLMERVLSGLRRL